MKSLCLIDKGQFHEITFINLTQCIKKKNVITTFREIKVVGSLLAKAKIEKFATIKHILGKKICVIILAS